MILRYCAEEKDENRKLYSVLKRDMKLSATLIKRLKVADGIRVNDEFAYTDHRIQPGDIISADILLGEAECGIEPEYGELEILYENDALIAVNKPCGMLVHPSCSKYYGTLAGYVLGYLQSTGQALVCHAVNRLDRDTSGVVLFAKSAHFKKLAIETLHDENAVKVYKAIIFGEFAPADGTFDMPIGRVDDSMRRIIMPDGQKAVTHYRTIATKEVNGKRISLLSLKLETGRTHQIRVHCSSAGAPIVGDMLYCTEESFAFSHSFGIDTQFLHAEKLEFTDPYTHDHVSITANITREDMKGILKLF